jgi:hypothetical protein
MEGSMENWWWTILPIVLAGLGYLAKRWIERRRRSEALRRKLQALALHQGMVRAGVNLSDLERIEREAAGG